MQNDILCAMNAGPYNKQKTRHATKTPWANSEGVGSNKAHAETRDPPSQDPRDHKEQPSRHDIHPDTLKQTPTTPGRNESGENN